VLNCENLVGFYLIVKRSLVALTIFFSVLAAGFGDLKPSDSNAPILKYFAPVQIAPRAGHEDAPNFTFDQRKPLLTITSVRQLIPNRDGRGVTIVLNEKDSQRYAELTRQFKGHLLICVAASDVISVGVVTSPTENGMIEFSDARDTGHIAKYLRRRFGM
jgi:preprotein translocase subunit SecD